MVQGMAQTTKQTTTTRRKTGKAAKAALGRLKRIWPATTAFALIALVASGSIMASVPSVNASPLDGPSAGAAPNPATTHLPGNTPAPAVGVPFFVDGGSGNVAVMTIAKGTYQDGAGRQLVLEVIWKRAGGDFAPSPSLLTVARGDGKPATLVSEATAESGPAGSLADEVITYTYNVGPGDATVTAKAKYIQDPTTITIPS